MYYYNPVTIREVKKQLRKDGYLVVWKWLNTRDGSLYSPVYGNTKWKVGQVHTSDRLTAERTKEEIKQKYVYQGFYVYLDKSSALGNRYNGKLYRLVGYPEDFVSASGCYALFHKLTLVERGKRIPKELLVKKPVVKKPTKPIIKVKKPTTKTVKKTTLKIKCITKNSH